MKWRCDNFQVVFFANTIIICGFSFLFTGNDLVTSLERRYTEMIANYRSNKTGENESPPDSENSSTSTENPNGNGQVFEFGDKSSSQNERAESAVTKKCISSDGGGDHESSSGESEPCDLNNSKSCEANNNNNNNHHRNNSSDSHHKVKGTSGGGSGNVNKKKKNSKCRRTRSMIDRKDVFHFDLGDKTSAEVTVIDLTNSSTSPIVSVPIFLNMPVLLVS